MLLEQSSRATAIVQQTAYGHRKEMGTVTMHARTRLAVLMKRIAGVMTQDNAYRHK